MRAVLLGGFRARLEVSLAHRGITLPWWIPACTKLTITLSAVVAVAQRSDPLPPAQIALAGLLAVAPILVWSLTGTLLPLWLDAAAVVTAVTIMLADPVAADFSVVLLIVQAAELATIAPPALVIIAPGAGIAVLAAAQAWGRMTGYQVDIGGVVMALAGGVMLRWYMRALDAERGNQDIAREQAMLAERQRIAREVHDVVAHSLSITLLHLTGARRALQQDREIDDAVDALVEAERVGRAAMADIRRTVGLLDSSPPATHPLSGIDDIAEMIGRTRAAGLDVRFEQHGDLTMVGASAGLGLYRIAQESLANIVKHAPEAIAHVRLEASAAGTRLTVRNSLPFAAPSRATSGSGSGLAGMSARATQLDAELRVGPSGQDWVVDVEVPSAADSDVPAGCPVNPVAP